MLSTSLKDGINFLFLSTLKIITRFFYRIEVQWIHKDEEDPWKDVRLLIFLNHTSLFEPLFIGGIPWRALWKYRGRIVVPAADITIKRPLVGLVFKVLFPRLTSITRKRDSSWEHFLDTLGEGTLAAILPEGRMKRATGLDKHGKPMSVKRGVADLIQRLKKGKMVILYSGGLHHVQVPGQKVPKIFKTIKLNMEKLDIKEFLREINARGGDFGAEVASELEWRQKLHCP